MFSLVPDIIAICRVKHLNRLTIGRLYKLVLLFFPGCFSLFAFDLLVEVVLLLIEDVVLSEIIDGKVSHDSIFLPLVHQHVQGLLPLQRMQLKLLFHLVSRHLLPAFDYLLFQLVDFHFVFVDYFAHGLLDGALWSNCNIQSSHDFLLWILDWWMVLEGFILLGDNVVFSLVLQGRVSASVNPFGHQRHMVTTNSIIHPREVLRIL